ncbi:S-layer homology domain-containing protein [Paenibacillus sepulcri]|uniref:S-layer homology domain-containing protein n=1 Tax=Paenibacillus sepulcri TaxID=359917 RepID=A0ABS7BUZ7_9BACL|nr:S-layer homology domain-containing protein [Paenibacillus sepulcri]
MPRNKLLSSLLVVVLLLSFFANFSSKVYAEEVIAEDKPVLNNGIYEISNPEQLLYISQNFGDPDIPKDGYYKLMNDIDMKLITNFEPFGRFYGTFDGNHKVIANLRIDMPNSGTVGFFNHLGDSDVQAVAKNLGLVDVYIRGGQTVGGVAGMLWGTVENVYVTGEVIGSDHSVGGIAGRIPEYSSGTIKQTPAPDKAAHPTIRNSYSLVNVREEGTKDSQGGLAGRVLNPNTLIENSYSAGIIDGYTRVGGLVGDLRTGVIRNSVAANPLMTAAANSGSVGSAVGRVKAVPDPDPDPDVDLYPPAVATDLLSFDKMKKVGDASGESFDGTTKTDAQLYDQATYEALGWDFGHTWEMLTVTDGGKTFSSPVLQGFEHQELAFDFDNYLSSIEVTVQAGDVESNSVTIDVYASDTEDREAKITDYSIIQSAKRPTSDQIKWEQQPHKTFTGLAPSTQYTFWIKVQSEDGKESGWSQFKQYTKYAILTDKMPKDISNSITLDPQTSASLVWSTDNIDLADSTVEIVKKTDSATLPSNQSIRFKGKNEVKEVHMTPGELVFDGIRNFHSVSVTGLEPGTEYIYRVGDAAEDAWSPAGSFKTAPASDDSVMLTYMADPQVSNSSAASAATFKTAQEMFPDASFTYIAGDHTESGSSNGQWDVLFQAGQDSFMKTPVVSALGNHDEENMIKYYMNNPDDPDAGLPSVYSFDYGPAHFTVLNSEHYSGEGLDKQIDWLKQDVADSDKQWHIVMLHKSLYAATDHVDDEDINDLRVALAPVLQELNIDAVLMGHDHSFSRGFVKDGYNAKPEKLADSGSEVFIKPDSPLYIVNGTMGNSKWYQKIKYDNTLYHVSPDYEFIDKTSATYDTSLHQQSFTAVKIEDGVMSLDTYFLEYDANDPNGYAIAPYLYDSIKISKNDYYWPKDSQLTASDVTQNSLSLAWTPANTHAENAQYRLYKDGSVMDTVYGNSYGVTGLNKDTTYNFKVETADASGGWSSNGPAITVRTPGDKPDASSNAALSSLALSGIKLDQTVTGNVYAYTATVPNSVSVTSVTYETADSRASAYLQLDGVRIDNPVNLSVGSNDISVVVTSQAGTKQTYSVDVTRRGIDSWPSSPSNPAAPGQDDFKVSDATKSLLGQDASSILTAPVTVQQNADGVTVNTVNETELLAMMADTANIKAIVVPVSVSRNGKSITSFTPELLTEAGKHEASAKIVLQGDGFAYEIPAAFMNVDALAKKLGLDASTVQKATINVSMNVVSDAAALEAISKSGGKLLSKAVEFAISIASDGKNYDFNDFEGTYINRSFELEDAADPAKSVGAVIHDDSSVSPVPTVFPNVGDRAVAVVKADHNSTYAVIGHSTALTDIANSWAKEFIQTLADKMIINGYEDGTFKPRSNVTRAEFVTMLAGGLGLADKDGASSFTDVSPSAWYGEVVHTVSERGFITGYEDGSFKPNQQISRQEEAVILLRVLKYLNKQPASVDADGFKDSAAIAGYAKQAVSVLATLNIVGGDENGNFNPASFATRAETAKMMMNLMKETDFLSE